jgi:hypothetical protein
MLEIAASRLYPPKAITAGGACLVAREKSLEECSFSF